VSRRDWERQRARTDGPPRVGDVIGAGLVNGPHVIVALSAARAMITDGNGARFVLGRSRLYTAPWLPTREAA
jgi:hypothetical protein